MKRESQRKSHLATFLAYLLMSFKHSLGLYQMNIVATFHPLKIFSDVYGKTYRLQVECWITNIVNSTEFLIKFKPAV
jgi:hypothetical protein